jgi:YHS domain-containing protein
MGRFLSAAATALTLSFVAYVVGCNSQSTNSVSQPAAKAKVQPGESSPPQKPVAQAMDDSNIAKGLADLSTEDRTIAIKQAVCPVSGEKLGMMGVPVKMDVKGHTVFLCCPSCKDELLGNPDEYLAKLNK